MISVDYVFVHDLYHLHLTSRGYGFRTIEYIPATKASKKHSKKEVKIIIKVFNRRQIGISQVSADDKFECIRESIAPVQLNIVRAGEHMGDIDRANRSLKEGTICEIH